MTFVHTCTMYMSSATLCSLGRWGAKASFIGANCIDCNSRPAGALSDEEIVAATLRELRENIPGAREASPLPAGVRHGPRRPAQRNRSCIIIKIALS